MNLAKQLWFDERGAVISTELIFVVTVATVGIVVGLTTYRDSVVQELGDTAMAVAALNQGFSYDAVTIADTDFPLGTFGFLVFTTDVSGSNYTDELDFGDLAADPASAEPACIFVQEPASDEGSQPTPNL